MKKNIFIWEYIKTYKVEIITVAVAFFSIYWIIADFEPSQIRGAIIIYIVRVVTPVIKWMGWPILFLSVLLLIIRTSMRLTTSFHHSYNPCPKCGKMLIRLSRTRKDRILSIMTMAPVGRYQCMDEECDWEGLCHIL